MWLTRLRGSRRYCTTQANVFELWTFNLRTSFASDRDGENRWENRAAGVRKLLARRAPAVVLAQEATAAMLHDLTTHGSLESAPSTICRNGDGLDEHCPVLVDPSQVEAHGGGTVWLSETPDGASLPSSCGGP